MLKLNKVEKDMFKKLSHDDDVKTLKVFIGRLIAELSDIENLSLDPISNAQNVKAMLKSNLLDNLEKREVEVSKEDNWD